MSIEQAFKETTGLTIEEGMIKSGYSFSDDEKAGWINSHDFLLDPLFWKALGVAMGKGIFKHTEYTRPTNSLPRAKKIRVIRNYTTKDKEVDYKKLMHRFISNL